MKIFKPLMCASVLGLACSLPAQAHGPWTDDHAHRHGHMHGTAMQMDSADLWNGSSSRDAHGLPTYGAIGTGSMAQDWAMSTDQGGHSSQPLVTQPSYAPRQPRLSDEYRMRSY